MEEEFEVKVEEELEVEVEEEMEVEVEEAGCRTSDTQGSMAALAEAEAWSSDDWRLITGWMALVSGQGWTRRPPSSTGVLWSW